jgi:hypothetical protein
MIEAWPIPEVGIVPEDLSPDDEAVLQDAVAEVVEVDDTLTEIPALENHLDETTQPILIDDDD